MICLPPELAKKLITGLKDGSVNLDTLGDISSKERLAIFEKIVGEGNARSVNALFESKLSADQGLEKRWLEKSDTGELTDAQKTRLKDLQQSRLISWIKESSGLRPSVAKNLLDKVEKMRDVLTPANEDAFYEDLAAQKLGVEHVTPEEAGKINDLADKAQEAKDALAKSPNDQKLQIAYGNEYLNLLDYVTSLKPISPFWTIGNITVQLATLPSSLLTSVFHMSASFVQAWGMWSTKQFVDGFVNQFKYFVSPEAYRDMEAAIVGHPDYPLAQSGKLQLTKLTDQLSQREEQIQSSLLQHIPLVKIPVNAFSRMFTGMLNYIRFARFTDLLDAARLRGEDVSKGSQAIHDIAKTVNDFTGRGNIGKNDKYAQAIPAINAAIWSPRKIAATMEMFDPIRYLDPRISKTARIGALRQLSGSLIATAALLELAHVSGAEVDLNPLSTNFMKAKFGDITIDFSGGSVTYLRLLARLVANKSISGTGKVTEFGKKFGSPTRLSEIMGFLRGRMSPTAAAMADLMEGKDAIGKPATLSSEAKNKLVPLVIQDFIEMANSGPHDLPTWLFSLSAILGANVQVKEPKK